MRLFILMLICAVLVTTLAEPDPKKYKGQKKNKTSNTTLTEEEKKFLRDVETKFGIKTDTKEDDKKEDNNEDKKKISTQDLKLSFPTIIAIEIVNDTESKGKGKRTIDANLGYGYRTNNGYSYSYFGKPAEEKGKFMIYPYSQEDIPSASHGGSSGHSSSTQVEIQPSKAFELVTVKDESTGYYYPKPSNEVKINYDNIKGLDSPPQTQFSHGHSQSNFIPSTLYTTYNGHEFSGLSRQFPSIMPNYFVNPSQLLNSPEYQSVGLTNDHLRLPGSNIESQRVVPVLVLRVPSSSLKNPTAELFANLPSNYPLSQYLNNVNLQDLVNQYFKKLGYSSAPPVMTYSQSGPHSIEAPSVNGVPNYGRQHYATPYVQPSYSHSDNSGVQYSAVQPVMARYPSVYPQRYVISSGHSLYHQPMHQHKYESRYRYVPQIYGPPAPQTHYIQSNYYQQTHENPASLPQSHVQDTSSELEYQSSPQINIDETHYEYTTPLTHQEHEAEKVADYEYVKQQNVESASPSYEHLGVSAGEQDYYSQQQEQAQKESYTLYPSLTTPTEEAQSHNHQGFANIQNYHYEQQSREEDHNNLILSENYPSKDHTIATVYPVNSHRPKPQNSGTIQTVSYVTPMPSSKYQSKYKIMVPQTFLTNPSTEKVSYVHSHSASAYTHPGHQDYSSEAEYTVGPHYVPPISKQKAPSYPRNYHSHPKRMAKPDRTENNSSLPRKHSDRNESKKLT